MNHMEESQERNPWEVRKNLGKRPKEVLESIVLLPPEAPQSFLLQLLCWGGRVEAGRRCVKHHKAGTRRLRLSTLGPFYFI